MKTFFAVTAALIAAPVIAVVAFTAVVVNSAGEIEQRERQCVSTGGTRYECKRLVATQINEEFAQSSANLKEASADLRDSLGM